MFSKTFPILLCAITLYAVDTSSTATQNLDMAKSKSIKNEIKDGITDSNRTSETNTVEVTLNTYPLFLALAQSECVKKPKTFADFGITAMTKSGGVDVYAQQFLSNAGSNSLPISRVTKQQLSFKKNTLCLIDEGARIAQAIQTFSIQPLNNVTKKKILMYAQKSYEQAREISDMNIELLARTAKEIILENECSFYQNQDTIKCGQIIIMGDGTVRFGSQPLWGMGNGVDQNFGISASLKVAMTSEETTTKDKSNSIIGAIDKTKKTDTQQSGKQEINTGKILPSFQ